ncbi:hypothetical protein LOAG_06427 [Loa loa]|uniref:Late endosomal/lysosomal adaptor and MAPK and MTOR activator 1 n=1 Tax=Loa loa TaxID=7209 RepID=A0A1I7VGA7_LOALO|nr:hypothetical protein LOAG_06427 [Loa loa]EFO22058.1 hypothetical protein LOAG_06427 [Loa loa]
MSAKRKTVNVRISDDEDEEMRAIEEGSRRTRPETQAPNATKKNRTPKKQPKNSNAPAAGTKTDDVSPDVVDQMNRPHIQQQYPVMDHAARANIIHPVMIDHANRPINMALYPGAPCWCSQISGDMRAIRELIGAVSNGIHCILQKVHMDQVHNAELMTKMLNTVEMIADTVTNLPLAQLQECDQYLLEEAAAPNANENPNDVDNAGAYYTQNDEQMPPPNQPPNNNFRPFQ